MSYQWKIDHKITTQVSDKFTIHKVAFNEHFKLKKKFQMYKVCVHDFNWLNNKCIFTALFPAELGCVGFVGFAACQ